MYISISGDSKFALLNIIFILVALSPGLERPKREGDHLAQSSD
jgi:hypothetical protein